MDATTRQVVLETIREVLADRGRAVGPVEDGVPLFADGLGLDSLDFATLVVRLEQKLNYDPFRSGEQDRLPRTVAELLSAYERVPRNRD